MSQLPQRRRYVSLFGRFEGRFGPRRCGLCGAPLPPRRQKWCSDRCAFFIARLGGEFSYWRMAVYNRDKKCAMCGMEPKTWEAYDGTIRPDFSLWVVDHIVPIAVGGAEFDLTNLQILCPGCNKRKTAKDIRVIAKARKLSSAFSEKTGRLDAFEDNRKSGILIQQVIDRRKR